MDQIIRGVCPGVMFRRETANERASFSCLSNRVIRAKFQKAVISFDIDISLWKPLYLGAAGIAHLTGHGDTVAHVHYRRSYIFTFDVRVNAGGLAIQASGFTE